MVQDPKQASAHARQTLTIANLQSIQLPGTRCPQGGSFTFRSSSFTFLYFDTRLTEEGSPPRHSSQQKPGGRTPEELNALTTNPTVNAISSSTTPWDSDEPPKAFFQRQQRQPQNITRLKSFLNHRYPNSLSYRRTKAFFEGRGKQMKALDTVFMVGVVDENVEDDERAGRV